MTNRLVRRARRRIDSKSGDDGFTLVEVMVAMTLFVIVAAAASAAIVGSIKSSSATRDRVAAANVAQTLLEQARVAAAPTSVPVPKPIPAGGVDYAYTMTVTPDGSSCVAGSTRTISVTVTAPGNNTQAVVVQTVVAC